MKLHRESHNYEAQGTRSAERRKDDEQTMTRHNGPVVTINIQRKTGTEESHWNGQYKQLQGGVRALGGETSFMPS